MRPSSPAPLTPHAVRAWILLGSHCCQREGKLYNTWSPHIRCSHCVALGCREQHGHATPPPAALRPGAASAAAAACNGSIGGCQEGPASPSATGRATGVQQPHTGSLRSTRSGAAVQQPDVRAAAVRGPGPGRQCTGCVLAGRPCRAVPYRAMPCRAVLCHAVLRTPAQDPCGHHTIVYSGLVSYSCDGVSRQPEQWPSSTSSCASCVRPRRTHDVHSGTPAAHPEHPPHGPTTNNCVHVRAPPNPGANHPPQGRAPAWWPPPMPTPATCCWSARPWP